MNVFPGNKGHDRQRQVTYVWSKNSLGSGNSPGGDQNGDSFIEYRGFHCMVDILLKLRRMKVIVSEVPMILRYDLKGGESKMRVGATVFNTLKLLVRRRFVG